VQHRCGNRATSVFKVPVIDGRYCIRQSQPQVNWTARAMFVPDLQM